MDIVRKLKWYVFVRLLFLVAIGIPGILTYIIFEGFTDVTFRNSFLLGIALLTNLIFQLLTHVKASYFYYYFLGIFWITSDILLVTALIYTRGGAESRSTILYAIPIIIASMLIGRRGTVAIALLSGILYSTLLLLDYVGIITTIGAEAPFLRYQEQYVVNSAIFFSIVFILIALAVNFITHMLYEHQQRLATTISLLEHAQKIAKIGSWEWNVTTGTVTGSTELHRIHNITTDTIQIEELFKRVHPDDVDKLQNKVAKAVAARRPFKAEYRMILPDRSVQYLYIEGVPDTERDHMSAGSMYTGILQDITEMQLNNEARKEFLSLASHQLRTPASGVKSYLSLLLGGHAGKMKPAQVDFVQKAFDTNEYELEIIEKFLNLANIESGKFVLHKQRIDVNAVVRSSVLQYEDVAVRKGHTLIIKIPKRPIEIYADEEFIKMCIDNMINNAIKYTPDGGKIYISTRKSKSLAYITVRDTGIGIKEEEINSIFAKFTRLRQNDLPSVKGTGLGLFLVQTVVRMHRGRVDVQSRRGKGTSVTIKIPLRNGVRRK